MIEEEEEEDVRRVVVVVPAHPVEDEVEEKPERGPILRPILLGVGILIIIASLLWALLSREDTGVKSVSPVLIGTWITSHPEYSDRFLELTSDTITFATGDTAFTRYAITGVVAGEGDNTESFIIHFEGVDGAKFRREIVVTDSGQSLFFKSQAHVVWTPLEP